MAMLPTSNQQVSTHADYSDDIRTCWICFGTDEDNPVLEWVQPCMCRGSGRWVHQSCLLLWVEEKKKENRTAKIRCPQCRVEYVMVYPRHDSIMSFVQVIDDLIYKMCPVIAAGVTVGIIFWGASSYGAFTIMQIFGEEDGLKMMEKNDTTALLLFLPIIPATLIVMKLVCWEDYLLTFLRKGSKYPVLRHFLPSLAYDEALGLRIDIDPQPVKLSSTRVFVGGLVLPTIAKVVGDVFFHTEPSPLKKCFLGGLSFIAIKGLLKMYYKQRTYINQSQRRVMNHETNVVLLENNPNSSTSSHHSTSFGSQHSASLSSHHSSIQSDTSPRPSADSTPLEGATNAPTTLQPSYSASSHQTSGRLTVHRNVPTSFQPSRPASSQQTPGRRPVHSLPSSSTGRHRPNSNR